MHTPEEIQNLILENKKSRQIYLSASIDINDDSDIINIMCYIFTNYHGPINSYTLYLNTDDLDYFCDTHIEIINGQKYLYTTDNNKKYYFFARNDISNTIDIMSPYDIHEIIVIDSNYNIIRTRKMYKSHTYNGKSFYGCTSIRGLVDGTKQITTYCTKYETRYLYLNSESFDVGYAPIKLPKDYHWTVISPNIIGAVIIGWCCICGNVKDFLTYLQSAKIINQPMFVSDEWSLNICIINDDKNYANKLDELKTNLYEAFGPAQALDIQIINLINEDGKIIYK